MGDRLTEEEKKRQASPTPYGDIFDELFPEYLQMGMTPEQYWDGEYGLKKAYRKAYELRVETELRLTDQSNWYMGQYIMCVLQCVPLLVGGLNVKASTYLPDYPSKPFMEKIIEDRKEADKKKREEDQMMMALAMFQSYVKEKNKTIESKPKAISAGQ